MEEQSSSRFLIGVAVVLAGLYFGRDAGLNRPAPDFRLPETYGGQVGLDSYRGRPVLLVFWMTSCGICRQELPLLERMSAEFRRRHIAVAAIHLGDGTEARDYLRANHINLTSLVDAEGTVGQDYRVSGVPKLVLIGEDGKIRRSSSGMVDEAGLRGWMDVVSAP